MTRPDLNAIAQRAAAGGKQSAGRLAEDVKILLMYIAELEEWGDESARFIEMAQPLLRAFLETKR